MIKILLVQPKKDQARIMSEGLKESGYTVLPAADAQEALAAMDREQVHLMIADSCCGGIELTEDLRNTGSTLPVIVTSENGGRAEMRRIFRSGADGYMVFPIDPEDLQMRVRNLLWRCSIADDSSLRFGGCVLRSQTLTVETKDGDIELRRMEFLLLEKLLSYPGKIFTRPQLMDDIWGYDSESDPRTVDTHIKTLRRKLRGVESIRIQTVRGLGYRAVMPRRLRVAEK